MIHGPMRAVFCSSMHSSRSQHIPSGVGEPHHWQRGWSSFFHHALIFLSMALILAPIGQAGPWHWVKTHKRIEFAAGAAIGASIIQWKGNTACQLGQHERCDLGYGSYHSNGFKFFSMGMDGLMLGAAEACWKADCGKFGYVLAYGTPTYQTAAGIKDFLSYKPEKEKP